MQRTDCYQTLQGSAPLPPDYLFFIGHLYRADPGQDHHRAFQACIAGPPDNWRRRIGRPRQSWLRTVEADLQPMNLGLATAKRRAQDRSAWRKLVTTAIRRRRHAPEEEEELHLVFHDNQTYI